MFVIQHISLKDIYMSYMVYVTYIRCVMLNNTQIHFKPSRTYIHIHQSIVFGHLLLRKHYSMAPPGLDPEEGSQRFSFFWWDFSSSDLGLPRSSPRAACFLFKIIDVSTCVYVPTVRLVSGVYSYSLFVYNSS